MILISQAQSKRAFGVWDDTPVVDTSYLAATDGYVVAYVNGGVVNEISGYTDGDDPPTTKRFVAGGAHAETGNPDSGFCMPVRKGDYWKVIVEAGVIGDLFWLPAES